MTEEPGDHRDEELDQLRDYYRTRDPDFDNRVDVAQTMALLVDLRRTAGLTQVEVAERMGVPQSTVARLESGTTDPRMSTVKKYVRGVGMQLVATEIGPEIADVMDLLSKEDDVTDFNFVSKAGDIMDFLSKQGVKTKVGGLSLKEWGESRHPKEETVGERLSERLSRSVVL